MICRNQDFTRKLVTNTPDKYEKYQGLKNIKREWRRCAGCHFYYQVRNYPLKKLEEIYRNGYRHAAFRGETISEAFKRTSRSENNLRVDFLKKTIGLEGKKVLDIGSGIGIFPESIKTVCDVECVEENDLSIDFIRKDLGMVCHTGIPDKKFDLVTLIHVLEHIEKPDDFLKHVHEVCEKIFVEVPDHIEFSFLPLTHDEFNSCHLWFFNVQCLRKLLERNGFEVTHYRLPSYRERNLDRIWMLADAIS